MYSEEQDICEKIQDTILALDARIGNLQVYLPPEPRWQFPRLCKAAIVIAEDPWEDSYEWGVCRCILTYCYCIRRLIVFMRSAT